MKNAILKALCIYNNGGYLEDLEKALSEIEELSAFDNKNHYFIDSGSVFSYRSISTWLIDRSQKTNNETSVDDLINYISDTPNEVFYRLAVVGLKVKSAIELSNDINIIPATNYTGAHKELLDRAAHSFFLRKTLDYSILTFSGVFETKVQEANKNFKYENSAKQELEDILNLLALSGSCYPLKIGWWIDFPDHVPKSSFSISFPRNGFANLSKTMVMEDSTFFIHIYEKWVELSDDYKRIFRIGLERLGKAINHQNLVDKAIDLGIAFEVFFLSKNSSNSELAQQIATRCSRFLGKNFEGRKKIFQVVKELYALRSKGVHTGSLVIKKNKIKNVEETLEVSFTYLISAVILMIERKEVDWEKVVHL